MGNGDNHHEVHFMKKNKTQHSYLGLHISMITFPAHLLCRSRNCLHPMKSLNTPLYKVRQDLMELSGS